MSILEKRELMGVEKGIEKGIEQGIEQSKKEIAINLLKENVEIAFITKTTGLSNKIIEELKNNLKS